MKWRELLQTVGSEPLFRAEVLASGSTDIKQLRLQLTRWVKASKLLQLRRGLYAVAPPYRSAAAEPFLIANALKPASYVSLHSALAYRGMIPEHVPTVLSVTTGRPETLDTALGSFVFRHLKRDLLFGYEQVELIPGQHAFVAFPEKALLDLVYFTPAADSSSYLTELRLQNLEILDPQKLHRFAERFGRPKLERAVRLLCAALIQSKGAQL